MFHYNKINILAPVIPSLHRPSKTVRRNTFAVNSIV